MPATTDSHALIHEHLPLAHRLARRFRGRGVDAEDLLQVARYALVKAAGNYDADRGAFAAYATATIRGELKRYFRDMAWGVRPPRHLQEIQADLGQNSHGDWDAIDPVRVARRLHVDVAEVKEALAARGCYRPDSIDASPQPESLLATADPRFELIDEWQTFRTLCRDLSPDERQLLQWRFVEERTQQDIADRLGISQMQVSRRLSRLLEGLRATVSASMEELPAAG